MAAVIILAGLWLVLMLGEPRPHIRIGLGSMAAGYVIAWYVPVWFKNRHVVAQNRLLERCRALLLLGSRAAEAGDKYGAAAILKRIRLLEGLWRYGNSIPFKLCLALWAIAWGAILCVAIRFAGQQVVHHGWTGELIPADRILQEVGMAALISITVPLLALSGYFEAWKNAWAIGNAGDRLSEILHGPRGISVQTEPEAGAPDFDGMRPHEIFGLGLCFTRRELDRARRRLVQELHPDRWHTVNPKERHAREEALKRVNAAYDLLRRETA